MSSTSNNYYENKVHDATERVVLAQDIKIVTYKDLKGKFYFPVLTPLLSKTKPYRRKKVAPSTKYQKSKKLKPKAYYESNYVVLTIPKSLVLLFTKKIPKGTEFTASFVGGEQEIMKLKITSVFKYVSNKYKADRQDAPRTPANRIERIPWTRHDPVRYKKDDVYIPQWSYDGENWKDIKPADSWHSNESDHAKGADYASSIGNNSTDGSALITADAIAKSIENSAETSKKLGDLQSSIDAIAKQLTTLSSRIDKLEQTQKDSNNTDE